MTVVPYALWLTCWMNWADQGERRIHEVRFNAGMVVAGACTGLGVTIGADEANAVPGPGGGCFPRIVEDGAGDCVVAGSDGALTRRLHKDSLRRLRG